MNEVSAVGSVSSDGDYTEIDDTMSGYNAISGLEPGEDYTLEARRHEEDLDPAMFVFEGQRTFAGFLENEVATLADEGIEGLIDFADDEIRVPEGPFGDPRTSITAPDSGEVTAIVTNYLSGPDDGGDGRFDYRIEVNRDGLGGDRDVIELVGVGPCQGLDVVDNG